MSKHVVRLTVVTSEHGEVLAFLDDEAANEKYRQLIRERNDLGEDQRSTTTNEEIDGVFFEIADQYGTAYADLLDAYLELPELTIDKLVREASQSTAEQECGVGDKVRLIAGARIADRNQNPAYLAVVEVVRSGKAQFQSD